MKVGFDAKRLYHNKSGLGNYSRYTVQQFLNQAPDSQALLYAAETSDIWPDDLGVFRPIGRWSSFQRFYSMNQLWEHDGIDIYHGLSNEVPWQSGEASCPVVVTMHDLLFMDFPEDYPFLDRQIYKIKSQRAAAIADQIIAISEVTKSDLIQRLDVPEDKIEVVYQSCDPTFLLEKSEREIQSVLQKYHLNKPFIICVGSFSHRKNQSGLIDAWNQAELSDSHDLVLVGRHNKSSDELKRRSDKEVKFLHQVSHDDLIGLMQASQFAVYPSLKEGFGIPVLEALASGKTCLVAEGTSCQEAGGDAVMTFEADRLDSLIEGLKRLASDEDMRKKLERNATGQLRHFAPSIQIRKLLQLYASLI